MERDNKSYEKGSHHGKMSKEQAGHMGGEAPHKCRGRECAEKEGKSHKPGDAC